MALAWNERIKGGEILGTGFYNDWITITNDVTPGRCAFNFCERYDHPNSRSPRRRSLHDTNPELLETMIAQEQTVFRYSDGEGNFINEFPVNPNNAATTSPASVTSKKYHGPHATIPERTPVGDPVLTPCEDTLKIKTFAMKTGLTKRNSMEGKNGGGL